MRVTNYNAKCLMASKSTECTQGTPGDRQTKQIVREKVWWPGIVQQVVTMVKACLPCQSVAGKSLTEPPRPTEMQDKP